jgi:hypothetical protein
MTSIIRKKGGIGEATRTVGKGTSNKEGKKNP